MSELSLHDALLRNIFFEGESSTLVIDLDVFEEKFSGDDNWFVVWPAKMYFYAASSLKINFDNDMDCMMIYDFFLRK